MGWTDIEPPKGGGRYVRFKAAGDYEVRILSEPIQGYEYWVPGDEKGKRKPIRITSLDDGIPSGYSTQTADQDKVVKFFLAFTVYEYASKSIKVMELTQRTIWEPLLLLAKNKKWGDPRKYDVTITRTDKDGKTAYSIVPSPGDQLPDSVLEEAARVNLQALFYGGDPFAAPEPGEMDGDEHPASALKDDAIPVRSSAKGRK